MYACLAATCHLHFWQDDRDLLRATAVTRGWNGYRNKSQHRKLTLEKKIISPLPQGFEQATFQSRVWRSNHWAIPAPPRSYVYVSCNVQEFRASKSNYVKRLCLVVLLVETVMSLFGKGFKTNVRVSLLWGHLAFHPQADRFLPSLYILPWHYLVEYSSNNMMSAVLLLIMLYV